MQRKGKVKSLTPMFFYILKGVTPTIDLPKLNPDSDCHSNKSVIFNVTPTLCTGKSLFYQLIYQVYPSCVKMSEIFSLHVFCQLATCTIMHTVISHQKIQLDLKRPDVQWIPQALFSDFSNGPWNEARFEVRRQQYVVQNNTILMHRDFPSKQLCRTSVSFRYHSSLFFSIPPNFFLPRIEQQKPVPLQSSCQGLKLMTGMHMHCDIGLRKFGYLSY